MARLGLLPVLISLLSPIDLPAFDQTAGAATGAVTGQTIDATGAAVAGVTVVIIAFVQTGRVISTARLTHVGSRAARAQPSDVTAS